jgi:hypothetical protein
METKKCSKCGRELPLTEFHKNGFNKKGQQQYRGYCKSCANKRESERYYQKKEYIETFKKECAKCGDTRKYVLDFHHKKPSEKDFTIGQLKKGSLDLIKKEVEKCVVLCANCHREFHHLEKISNITLDKYLNS